MNNRIVVQPPAVPGISPDTLRRNIERALERHAEHAAKHVQIEVRDGTAILSGDVSSWAERKAIEGAARGTPGVWTVDSRLRFVVAV